MAALIAQISLAARERKVHMMPWCHDTGVWYEMKDSFPEERARGAHSRYSEECVQTAQVNTGGIWQAWYCDARFDSHFDPEKHNLYLKRHLLAQTKSEESREEKVTTTTINTDILLFSLDSEDQGAPRQEELQGSPLHLDTVPHWVIHHR